MKPMTLNLSRMTKIAGDKKTSTFKHERGHEICILHIALPIAMRKEIEKLPISKAKTEEAKPSEKKEAKPKLAEGGNVLPKHMHPPKNPKMEAVPRLAMAEGGMAHEQGPCKNPNCKSYGKVHPNCRCYGGFAKGGVVQSACDSKSYHHPSCELYSEGGKVDKLELDTVRPDAGFGSVTVKDAEGGVVKAPSDWMSAGSDPANQSPQGSQNDVIAKDRKNDADEKENYGGMTHKDVADDTTHVKAGERVKLYADPTEPVSAEDSAPTVDMDPDALVEAPEIAAPQAAAPPQQVNPAVQMANQNPMRGVAVPVVQPPAPNVGPDGSMNPAAINQNVQSANEAQKDVNIAAGQAEANRQIGYSQALGKHAQNVQQNFDYLAGHIKDLSDYNKANPINENHYMESMSTGRKVRTAFGLFLSGLGAGIGGHAGSNPALDYLNRQIDRDIEGQKARADQQKTIYGAYRELYGEGVATNASTKASMLSLYSNQAKQIAAELGTPQAQANAAKFGAAAALEASKTLKDAAVSVGDLPGTVRIRQQRSQPPGAAAPAGTKKIKDGRGQGASNSPPTDNEHLLTPEANESFKRAQYKPEYKNDTDEVRNQLEGAALADKAVDSINKHFTRMYSNVHSNEVEPTGPGAMNAAKTAVQQTLADLPGYIHKKGENLEGVPYIGSTISGLARGATDTAQNRSYDVHRDAMLSSMTAALVHSGMSPTEAHDTAITFLPVEGDDMQAAREKMATAKEKIKQTTKINALERHNLIQRQRKK